MLIGLQPQAVLGRLGQVAPEDVVQVLEQRFSTPDHKGEQGQHPQLLGHRRNAEIGQNRLLAAHHHIHRQTDQHRRSEVKQLVQQGARDCRPDQPSLGLQMTQQSHQWWTLIGSRPGRSIRHGCAA